MYPWLPFILLSFVTFLVRGGSKVLIVDFEIIINTGSLAH